MDLAPLLAPRSIAVVGATDRPDSYGGNVLRNLDRAGYGGDVWGVNPKRETVLGRPCVPAVDDLPEPVDALVVAVPAVDVAGIVRSAAERGCRGAIVLSAGFAEAESGVAHEAALREVARQHRLPVCGPNGNGIVAVAERAAIWGDGLGPIEPGPVAMVTQSGNVGVNALGSRRGVGWHTVVSTGNQTVCAASDWVVAVAERDGVGSIALFLESDDDGAKLAEALATCVERGVGVAVLKVGSSEAGVRAAAAHTGSLAGDQRVFRALVEEAGAASAEDFHDLLELAKALAEPRARSGNQAPQHRRGSASLRSASRSGGLAVLTCSGGDSGVAGDRAADLGIELPPLSDATVARLGELLPDAATIANPLDYTAMIWGNAELLAEIVRVVGADPAIDQLLLCYDQPADADPSWAAVRAGLLAGAGDADAAALVAATLPDLLDHDAAIEFGARGLPAIAGLRTALVCARALRASRGDPGRLREIAAAARRADGEREEWLAEGATKELLRAAGIAVPKGGEADDAEGCLEIAERIGWPVAVKLSGARVTHKSDVGGLALGLADREALLDAYVRLRAAPVDGTARILVERMVEPGVELLVSARSDAVVPALTVGLGGIWTESLADVAVVPLPATPERVERALLSLRGAALLGGGRGRQPVAIEAAAELGARLGDLLLAERLTLIELNPVVVSADAAVAVDALAG
jgi:acetate---CoA ligase (ADP-forming)